MSDVFRTSQSLYRPLQQHVSERVIENLHIFATKENLQFVSAKFIIRLLQNNEQSTAKTDKQQSTYARQSDANAKYNQGKIDRLNANICWPAKPFPSRFIPITELPSDILGVEQICLELISLTNEIDESTFGYSCGICRQWSRNCVSCCDIKFADMCYIRQYIIYTRN